MAALSVHVRVPPNRSVRSAAISGKPLKGFLVSVAWSGNHNTTPGILWRNCENTEMDFLVLKTKEKTVKMYSDSRNCLTSGENPFLQARKVDLSVIDHIPA